MSNQNPNSGGIISPPPVIEIDPILIPLDPEIEELWSSRALLIVSFSFRFTTVFDWIRRS